MADRKNYCLRLDDFRSNIRTTWEQLLIESDFCDVTLACRGGKIKTHRIIISHSRPVLKDILKQNLSEIPVIYLKDIE